MSRKIDRLPPPDKTRAVEMKVLCLSAPRSGSSSAGQALKILGYTPFAGMAHNYFVDNRFSIWDEAINARYNGKGQRFTRSDFEKFLGPYDAVSGWFAAILAEDLVAAYPEAKAILTTRDPDKWVESWDGTVVEIQKWWEKWRWILPLCGGKERDFRRNAETSLEAWSRGDPFDRSQQRLTYVGHNQLVRDLVPREKLLEMEAGGDWKPLCEFLGKEVPKGQAYPHSADRATFHKNMGMIWRLALGKAVLHLGAGVGVGVLALLVVYHYRRPGQGLFSTEILRKLKVW